MAPRAFICPWSSDSSRPSVQSKILPRGPWDGGLPAQCLGIQAAGHRGSSKGCKWQTLNAHGWNAETGESSRGRKLAGPSTKWIWRVQREQLEVSAQNRRSYNCLYAIWNCSAGRLDESTRSLVGRSLELRFLRERLRLPLLCR